MNPHRKMKHFTLTATRTLDILLTSVSEGAIGVWLLIFVDFASSSLTRATI